MIVLPVTSVVQFVITTFQGTNQTDFIDSGTNQTDTNIHDHNCLIASAEGEVVGKSFVVFAVVYADVVIIFDIWTIIVAKNAKKEIEDGK